MSKKHAAGSARAVLVLAERPHAPPRRRAVADTTPMLDHLARAARIAPEWWEIDGTRHVVSVETKRALLAAMRLPADGAGAMRASLALLAERTIAARCRRPSPAMRARLWRSFFRCRKDSNRRPVDWSSRARTATERRLRVGVDEGVVSPEMAFDGRPYRAWRIILPPLPIGRHRVTRDDVPDASATSPSCRGTAICRRRWRRGGFGLSAQLYALRRPGDQGIGDFTTLAALAEAAGARDAGVIGLNPLHALFAHERQRASPYQPSDRRFLDPIYLDVAAFARRAMPEFAELAAQDAVGYQAVWNGKRAILERYFSEFEAASQGHADFPDARAFAAFVNDDGEALHCFALFEAIAETRPGEPWRSWPEGLRHQDAVALADFAAAHDTRLRFHQFLQFLCDRQLAGAAAAGRNGGLDLGLLRDLAVGAAPDGAEAWANADQLAWGASIGAPPDPFAREGQNWGLPPPDPLGMAAQGYDRFARMLRANMRHAGGLRIDHVMGLSRLFWVPQGAAGRDGAYVAYPMDDLLGHIALESVRAQCLVIGEDLGTVAEGFRDALAAHEVFGFRVLLLERDGIAFRPPSSYPAGALACVSTHDLPTLAGWWDGADIAERARLGMIDTEVEARQTAERADEKAALRTALSQEGIAPADAALTPELVAAVHEYVARTPSALMLVQSEELAGETTGVNLPGTDWERPNWRRKLAPMAGDLMDTPAADAILRPLRAMRSKPVPEQSPGDE